MRELSAIQIQEQIENEYENVLDCDPERIKQIVLAAKGSKRTMKQFAEDTGISAPTLSRMVTGKVPRQISIQNMSKIICHAAPKSGVSIISFARANGYLPKADSERLHREARNGNELISDKEKEKQLMTVIIKSGLFERGILPDTTIHEENSEKALSFFDVPLSYHFHFNVNLSRKVLKWAFVCNPITTSDIKLNFMQKDMDVRSFVGMQISLLSEFFFTDIWEPEKLTDHKISICLTDEVFYNIFFEYLSKMHFNNRFSLLLINLDKLRITSEICFESAIYGSQQSVF